MKRGLAGSSRSLEAARRLLVVEPPGMSAIRLRRDLVEAATGIRLLWIGLIEEAKQGLDGFAFVDLGDGWFRIEDPLATGGLKRILKPNRRRDD